MPPFVSLSSSKCSSDRSLTDISLVESRNKSNCSGEVYTTNICQNYEEYYV